MKATIDLTPKGIKQKLINEVMPLKDFKGWNKNEIYPACVCALSNGRFAIFTEHYLPQSNYATYSSFDELLKDFEINPTTN